MTNTNLTIVLQQSAINIVLAAGMTFVILTGGIDLSVGSILAASAMVAVIASLLPDWGLLGFRPPWVSGSSSASSTALLIAFVRLPPFIVTLGTLTAIAASRADRARHDRLQFGSALRLSAIDSIFGMPWLVGDRPRRRDPVLADPAPHSARAWIYAVGGNAEAARLSGIKVRLVLLFVYGVSGFLAGLGGAMSAARLLAANGLQLGSVL